MTNIPYPACQHHAHCSCKVRQLPRQPRRRQDAPVEMEPFSRAAGSLLPWGHHNFLFSPCPPWSAVGKPLRGES